MEKLKCCGSHLSILLDLLFLFNIDCLEEHFSLAKNTGCYHDNDSLTWLNRSEVYVYADSLVHFADYKYCVSCGDGMYSDHDDFYTFMLSSPDDSNICQQCITALANHSQEPF